MNVTALHALASPAPERIPEGYEFAVVVPTYNEVGNVERIVSMLDAALEGIRFEIVFVDDWSPDGTARRIEEIASERSDVRVVRRFGRKGLSGAVIEGMMATMAPIVAVIDGDGQHDERLLPRLFAIVRDGAADVAIGSRYCAEGSVGGWDAKRLRASRAATRLSRLVLQSRVADPMSGFFAVRRDRVEAMLPRLSGRGFKILFDLLTSSPEPLKAVEIPFEFRLRTAGESKLGTGVAVDYLVTVADRLLRRHLPSRFVMFSAVGSFGVLVNLLTCLLLVAAGLPQDRALLASTIIAFGTNFHLDNVVTFRDRRLSGLGTVKGLLLYAGICGLGAMAGTSIGAMIYSGIHRPLRNAVACAVIGVLWNFVGASKVVWRRRR